MKMAKDPVCGMMVDEKKAKLKSDYNDKTYYFCSPSCKATFDKSPAKFVGNPGSTGHGCNCGHDHC
jgi:YHS domain-containing protein